MTVLDTCKAILDVQTDKGIHKYGQTLDTAGLPLSRILEHLAEELADALQYAVAARVKALESELCRNAIEVDQKEFTRQTYWPYPVTESKLATLFDEIRAAGVYDEAPAVNC